jgi:hypothetical protein
MFAGEGLCRIRKQQQAEREAVQNAASATREREAWAAAELELDARIDAEWDAMGEPERRQRLQRAEEQLKTEKRWQHLSPDARKKEAQSSARQELRRKLEGNASAAGG